MDYSDNISTISEQSDPGNTPPLQRPDERMARLRCSLEEFNDILNCIIDGTAPDQPDMTHNERIDAFVIAALCGRLCNDTLTQTWKDDGVLEGNVRVYIDALHNIPAAVPHRLTLTRDCDSLIGRSFELPFRTFLSVFPIPRSDRTLRRANHVRLTIQSQVSTYNL